MIREALMRNGLGLMLSIALAGCGGSSNNGSDGGADMKGGMEVCNPDGKTIQLAQKYGVQANLLVNVKVTPGCSGASCIVDTDANSELLLLVTMNQNGTMATVSAQPCKIVIPPVALKGQSMPLTLSASKMLIQSVPAVMANATLSSTMTCANFTGNPITLALGANLMNAQTDPLPAFTQGGNPSIPYCGGAAPGGACGQPPAGADCVCDQDSDGKPGATVQAMNVPGLADLDAVYLDLRTSVTLTGQVFPQATAQTNPGPRIKGTVSALKLDTQVLGCHHMGGADCSDSETNTAAALNPAVTQSVNGPSTFIAVPLSSTDTCDSLVANEASLFQ